jgi:hypothetical protein
MEGEKPAVVPEARWLQGVQEAFFTQRCLSVVARLGVPDALISGPMAVDTLADKVGAKPDLLYRVLRFLASQGVFAESPGRVFALTPRAELLRSDNPNSARWHFAHDVVARASAEIVHSVTTGKSAFEKAFGTDLWDYLAAHPRENDWFNRHMQSQSVSLTLPLVDVYDWSRARTVVDVGGGTGRFISAVLRQNTHLCGVLVDQPHVVTGATAVLADAGVADRCRVEAGSFLEPIRVKGDIYVLSRILHDWDDDSALRILKAVRAPMPLQARLLILEMLVPEDGAPHASKMFDIAMMVVFGGGRERTVREFASLLGTVGLQLKAVIPGSGPISIIEAVPK